VLLLGELLLGERGVLLLILLLVLIELVVVVGPLAHLLGLWFLPVCTPRPVLAPRAIVAA